MDAKQIIEQIEIVKAKAIASRDFWATSQAAPGCVRKQHAAAIVKIQECDDAIAQVRAS